ncbi:MAG: nicotinate-nucleotide adenylyltransferase [Brevirhabdus sp.]
MRAHRNFARHGLPYAQSGQVVGLLGGSFDPPHAGHVHITKEALKRFGLDRVWWLVTPGNPLKENGPAPLERRVDAARRLMRHPRVDVTGIEAVLGTTYTAETLSALMSLYPGVRFIWLMGADNLAGFHRWKNWREIMENVPIGVLARPETRIQARTSPAATAFKQAQLRIPAARVLAKHRAPAWCLVNVPMVDLSSTRLRRQGQWKR